jgi:hypothetical protein
LKVTAQINDMFRYRESEYSVAGISEGELVDISILDMKPAGTCTACWRGYQAVFAANESRLVLDALHVNLLQRDEGKKRLDRVDGPTINGVAPAAATGIPDSFDNRIFNNHYEGLNFHLEYSGGVLLADGFIRGLYVHMGFHPAWKYETVIELIFEGGVLKGEFDRSVQMAEIRETFSKSKKERWDSDRVRRKDEIRRFVERAFDRRYKL